MLETIRFQGLIRNRSLRTLTSHEFVNAIRRCGWKEGTGTHFLQQLKEDGPTRGITTLGHLERAIRRGRSEAGRDGSTLHRICNESAYIVYNASTRVLVTFSQGRPRVAAK